MAKKFSGFLGCQSWRPTPKCLQWMSLCDYFVNSRNGGKDSRRHKDQYGTRWNWLNQIKIPPNKLIILTCCQHFYPNFLSLVVMNMQLQISLFDFKSCWYCTWSNWIFRHAPTIFIIIFKHNLLKIISRHSRYRPSGLNYLLF